MALAHRCKDGTPSKLVRQGPVGTMEGVTFSCPRCGHSRDAQIISADVVALMPAIVKALAGSR